MKLLVLLLLDCGSCRRGRRHLLQDEALAERRLQDVVDGKGKRGAVKLLLLSRHLGPDRVGRHRCRGRRQEGLEEHLRRRQRGRCRADGRVLRRRRGRGGGRLRRVRHPDLGASGGRGPLLVRHRRACGLHHLDRAVVQADHG